MRRFFLDPGSWGADAALEGAEAIHCTRVLRARVGDEIEVFDGDGRRAKATIRATSKHRVDLELGGATREEAAAVPVALALAVIKGKAMDWLVQKAVELGATEIRPLMTERVVVKSSGGTEEKWSRNVLEACKQCGRAYLPRVAPVEPLEDFLAREISGLKVMASLEPGAMPLSEVLAAGAPDARVIFLVGPEGDFSADEYAAARTAGFRAVTLGPRVLRSETAALFGLCALNYALDR